MRIDLTTFSALLLLAQTSIALPPPIRADLAIRDEATTLEARTSEFYAELDGVNDLWKRKGGGGSGGKGGGSSSSGSSSSGSSSSSGGSSSSSAGKGSSGSSSSSSSSNSGSSSSSGRSSTLGSSTSTTGGRTKTGSGVTPNYGGGRYYGGGATVPYSSGVRSPSGITPVFLAAAALSFYPGLWLFGAYGYPYYHPYTFVNHSAHGNTTNTTTTKTKRGGGFAVLNIREDDTGVNETKPVTCYCALYAECGCDDDGTTTFLDSVIGTGDYFALNQTLITVADVNGTSTILLNGTLPNGTTASGGTESANAASQTVIQGSGYLLMTAIVGAIVLLA